MTTNVIQGSFLGGQPKLAAVQPRPAPPPIQARTMVRPPGPPATALAVRAPGPPAPAFSGRPPAAPAFVGQQRTTVQRHAAAGAFAVDAGPLGLVSTGGRPLPEVVRGKMEAALGADFSAVRVHVGPQAERIGAIAFTVGSDIYFAPGRYQPDTIHGQQLLGHELAHVVQQRAGRVRNPLGSGLAVVQDHALEAEADRLGQRAAMHRVAAQAKLASKPKHAASSLVQAARASHRPLSRVERGPAVGLKFAQRAGTIQRLTSLNYNPVHDRPETDTVITFRHGRVMHNATQRTLAAYLSGYDDVNDAINEGCNVCNHYVPYNSVAAAVEQELANQGTLTNVVNWLNNLPILGNQAYNYGFPFQCGAQPQPNIAAASTNAFGVNFYSEAILNHEVDDLIFNLANDPRNLFYWPDSSTDHGGTTVDNPQWGGGNTYITLTTLRNRLQGYRNYLLNTLNLNVV